MNNRALEKIKKCLRLAKSDNPGEAAAALRQAQKLMAKHGLTHSDLELADVEQHSAKSTAVENPPDWVWYLMHTIGKAFAVECLNHTRRGPETRWRAQSHALFIGVGSAPQVASYAYTILFRQLRRDRQAFLSTLPRHIRRAIKTRRADLFAEAWVTAVRDKVAAMAMKPEHKALVERWKEREYGDTGIEKAKDRSHGRDFSIDDAMAMRQGLEAGSKVDLHHGVGASEPPARIDHHRGATA